jgi:hypothetical protein
LKFRPLRARKETVGLAAAAGISLKKPKNREDIKMFKTIMRYMMMFMLMAVGACTAFAQGQPSAKATFAYEELIDLPLSSAACGPNATPPFSFVLCSDSDGWTPILTQEIKVANSKSLFIAVSLQCGLITDVTEQYLIVPAGLDLSAARANIRVRVAIYRNDELVGYAKPNKGRAACTNAWQPGVVFCDRIQNLKAKFSGLGCHADETTHVVTCNTPEAFQLILNSLSASSFNFLAADLKQGVYKIVVEALTGGNFLSFGSVGPDGSLGNFKSFIGAGSVAIEAVRLIKDKDEDVAF